MATHLFACLQKKPHRSAVSGYRLCSVTAMRAGKLECAADQSGARDLPESESVMCVLKTRFQAHGTRILVSERAKRMRATCDTLMRMAEAFGAEEIVLPMLEPVSLYNRAGEDALCHIYSFPDPRTGKTICLRPEGTATCQAIAQTAWKDRRDVKLFYITRCWRYKRTQLGRYLNEFTQFGVEILNPHNPQLQMEACIELAGNMMTAFSTEFALNRIVKRKYAYYGGEGFEIVCEQLGAQKQVCGGGPYSNGCGFAFGVDRLMML